MSVLVVCLRALAVSALAFVAYLAGRRHERASMLARILGRRDALACALLAVVGLGGCRDSSSSAAPRPPTIDDKGDGGSRPGGGRPVGVIVDTETGAIYARIVIR